MTSDPVFYPLLLAALVLVCVIIHSWRPDPRRATPPPPVRPVKPHRKPSKEPKSFAGYIQKPLCEACEHGLDSPSKAPGSPPPAIIFNRGRKRTVDTPGHFCPDPDCAYRGYSAWAISAPMAILAANPGASFNACRVRDIFMRLRARFSMASGPRRSSLSTSSPVWPKGSAFEAQRGSSRSIPIPYSSG